jgi:hypothetical protein
MNELAIITAKDLSLVENPALNERQLKVVIQRTPAKFIKQRPAKGGGTWDYVSGGYVTKVLNLAFGFDWDFEITNQMVLHGEAIVQGKLTVRSNGKTIVKTQFGNKDIMYKKQTEAEKSANEEKSPLSIGNDLKAAATDCLKKCAVSLGIAADVYNKAEFNEIHITPEGEVLSILEQIKTDFADKVAEMSKDDVAFVERVIENQSHKEYRKAIKTLNSYEQVR